MLICITLKRRLAAGSLFGVLIVDLEVLPTAVPSGPMLSNAVCAVFRFYQGPHK